MESDYFFFLVLLEQYLSLLYMSGIWRLTTYFLIFCEVNRLWKRGEISYLISTYYYISLLGCVWASSGGLSPFFSQASRLYVTFWVMTDFKRLLRTWFSPAFCPHLYNSALPCRWNKHKFWVYPLFSRSWPSWSFFCSHSNSLFLAASLSPTSMLSEKISVVVLLLFHLLMNPLAIFSQPELAMLLPNFLVLWLVLFVFSSICGI